MKRLVRNQDKFWGKDNYKGNKYIIGSDGVTSKQMVIDKLGQIEDLLENADSIKIIKRNGVASLHIDMILDDETYPIAEQLFGKEKVVDYDR
jgi:hypothetical protein